MVLLASGSGPENTERLLSGEWKHGSGRWCVANVDIIGTRRRGEDVSLVLVRAAWLVSSVVKKHPGASGTDCSEFMSREHAVARAAWCSLHLAGVLAHVLYIPANFCKNAHRQVGRHVWIHARVEYMYISRIRYLVLGNEWVHDLLDQRLPFKNHYTSGRCNYKGNEISPWEKDIRKQQISNSSIIINTLETIQQYQKPYNKIRNYTSMLGTLQLCYVRNYWSMLKTKH